MVLFYKSYACIVILKKKLKNYNKYQYRYEGIEKTDNGMDIHLHNLTDGTETYVEKKWFGQRKIKIM